MLIILKKLRIFCEKETLLLIWLFLHERGVFSYQLLHSIFIVLKFRSDMKVVNNMEFNVVN